MELRHLRYFKAVAENGGFARAARLLHVAQSAISGQIRDLEEELGVPLFDRAKRQIRLTYHGELFLKDAKTLLASADSAVANMQRSLRGEVGTLTIGFFAGGTGPFFPAIIKEFKRRFQDVQVSLVEMTTPMHHKALQAGTIDVAFTRPAPPSDAATLHLEHHLHSDRLSAAMLKSHPLAKKRSIFVRELADERFIVVDRNSAPFSFDKVISLCTEAGFSPRIGTTASNAVGAVALVEAGEGVAILSHAWRGNGVVFVPLADRMAFMDLVIAWAPQHENPVLRSFLDVALKKRRKP
ncbi:LysR family transcriptional regulator [Alloacidobacterium dinghuense]|uniref:LysR family transcriptional regulator n=1 Tax=Alloacidobacterium dinghuense TaxID=2763107 RepID=A0A7G8BNY6_9BACT|nr:LysR family transcriptional regulator [Alloacidobacterium dinghuense]QNI34256.1 LysR family transcriptional regulator [Alloacidobacterium dinghuense]